MLQGINNEPLNEGVIGDAIRSFKEKMRKKKEEKIQRQQYREANSRHLSTVSRSDAEKEISHLLDGLNSKLKSSSHVKHKVLVPFNNHDAIIKGIEDERRGSDEALAVCVTDTNIHADAKTKNFTLWTYELEEYEIEFIPGATEDLHYVIYICGTDIVSDEEYEKNAKYLEDNKHMNESTSLESLSSISNDMQAEISTLSNSDSYDVMQESIDIKGKLKQIVDTILKYIDKMIQFIKEKMIGKVQQAIKTVKLNKNGLKDAADKDPTMKFKLWRSIYNGKPISVNAAGSVSVAEKFINSNAIWRENIDGVIADIIKASDFYKATPENIQHFSAAGEYDIMLTLTIDKLIKLDLQFMLETIHSRLEAATNMGLRFRNALSRLNAEYNVANSPRVTNLSKVGHVTVEIIMSEVRVAQREIEQINKIVSSLNAEPVHESVTEQELETINVDFLNECTAIINSDTYEVLQEGIDIKNKLKNAVETVRKYLMKLINFIKEKLFGKAEDAATAITKMSDRIKGAKNPNNGETFFIYKSMKDGELTHIDVNSVVHIAAKSTGRPILTRPNVDDIVAEMIKASKFFEYDPYEESSEFKFNDILEKKDPKIKVDWDTMTRIDLKHLVEMLKIRLSSAEKNISHFITVQDQINRFSGEDNEAQTIVKNMMHINNTVLVIARAELKLCNKQLSWIKSVAEAIVKYANKSDEPVNESATLHEAITAATRKNMDTGLFALPSERKYPIQDLKHVRSAIGYSFKVDNPEKLREMAQNIARRIQELHAVGKVHVHQENPLYEYCPEWMRYKHESVNESVDLLTECISKFDTVLNTEVLQEGAVKTAVDAIIAKIRSIALFIKQKISTIVKQLSNRFKSNRSRILDAEIENDVEVNINKSLLKNIPFKVDLKDMMQVITPYGVDYTKYDGVDSAQVIKKLIAATGAPESEDVYIFKEYPTLDPVESVKLSQINRGLLLQSFSIIEQRISDIDPLIKTLNAEVEKFRKAYDEANTHEIKFAHSKHIKVLMAATTLLHQTVQIYMSQMSVIRATVDTLLSNSKGDVKLNANKPLNDKKARFTSMNECIQESVSQFRDNLSSDLSNPLWSVDLDSVRYTKEVPHALIESAGLERATRVWNLILEDAEFKSVGETTNIPVLYVDYCPSTVYNEERVNGGLGTADLSGMSDADIIANYDSSKNLYPAKGMLQDINHIRFISRLNNFHDKYVSMIRNPEEDKAFIAEWFSMVDSYFKSYQQASNQNACNAFKQKLYDIRWNWQDNPYSADVRKNNLDAWAEQLEMPIQESYNYDVQLYNNDGTFILQEGIGSNIAKWFVDKKVQITQSLKTLSRKRASESNYYARWKHFNCSEPFELYSAMNDVFKKVNNTFSMNDILSTIGIELKGDVFRRYNGFLSVEDMKSVVIAGTFKKNDIEYFKGMVLANLCNFLILTDRKDKPLLKPISEENIGDIVKDKYLGYLITEPVNTNMFALNAKLIPVTIAQNAKMIDIFQQQMKMLMANLDKTVIDNPEVKELLIFREVFEYISSIVVEIILGYNDTALMALDLMDKIYETGMSLNESISYDEPCNGIEDETILIETIEKVLEIYDDPSALLEAVDLSAYPEYKSLLEAVSEMVDINSEAVKEAKQGKLDKIKKIPHNVKEYLFRLNPENAKRLMPAIIRWVTKHLICTVLINIILGFLGVHAAEVGLIVSIVGEVIGILVEFVDRVTQNGINAKEADSNIKAIRDSIDEIDKKTKDPKVSGKLKNILQLYKVRLNNWIAELEESKTQRDVVHMASESIKGAANSIKNKVTSVKDKLTHSSEDDTNPVHESVTLFDDYQYNEIDGAFWI